MNPSWKKVLGSAWMALGVTAILAVSVQARPATRGHFVLPYDVQWGTVALPAGDYTFTIDHLTPNGTIVLYRGTRAAGIVRPQDLEGAPNQVKSGELLCVRHDGKATVRALALPEAGTFYFALPKGMKALVASQPQLIESVSVERGGE